VGQEALSLDVALGKVMRLIVCLGSLLITNAVMAQGVTDMACKGVFNDYDAKILQSEIRDTGGRLDFNSRVIRTPIGSYRIDSVDEREVQIEDSVNTNDKGYLRIWGKLDRHTGDLYIIWQRPNVDNLTYLAEFSCTPSRRLF
jgi:hypothetical protein